MTKLFSRKLWVSMVGLGLIAASGPLGLSTTALAAIGGIVAAYVGSQGYTDSMQLRRPGSITPVVNPYPTNPYYDDNND
ncbi:MAG TPA: hypothetical protein PKW95_20635 [bacterium]|nr:hypothetical protein [bacterium]